MQASPAAIDAFDAALPDDARVVRKRMFGNPCAFVNRQMFFGTFGDTVVARVGPERVEALDGEGGLRVFTPMPERPWRDYVQADAQSDPARLRELAADALAWTLTLPPKVKKPKATRR
ncbi:MAG: TfoX/Sxy family protein [Myxococcota bacterium]